MVMTISVENGYEMGECGSSTLLFIPIAVFALVDAVSCGDKGNVN